MKTSIIQHIFFCCLFVAQATMSSANDSTFIPNNPNNIYAQNDSVIITYEVPADNDTIFRYNFLPFGYHTDINELNNTNKHLSNDSINLFNNSQPTSISVNYEIDTNKAVGKIPYSEGATPSGGKTYSIPIITAPVKSATPQVAITYNSQSGNGVAGYGWGISGLSAITVTPKNLYYDGKVENVDLFKPDSCAFTLDGMRLIKKTGKIAGYQYETAQGFILVKKNINAEGYISHFNVMYPNGNRATFGFPGNTSTKHIYPLTSIMDINGFRVDFEYIESGNNYYVSKIKYGGQSSTSHPAEIVFQYVDRIDFVTAYFAGVEIKANKLLNKIISYNDNQELRTYSLVHAAVDNVQRLTQVDCGVGSSYLNPLKFNYDTYHAGVNGRLDYNSHGAILTTYFADRAIYVRGKFIKNDFNDGLISFPEFTTYGKIGEKESGALLFGSQYSPTQNIIITPKLNYTTDALPIQAESGFQNITAVDINGDGIDEIVKINFNGTTEKYTILKLTVYSVSENNTLSSYFFNVLLWGVVKDYDLISPISRGYFFGDFKGNGKVQLLTISHNKTFRNVDVASNFDLIDLENGSLTPMKTAFSYAPDDFVFAADINGDGRSELCKNTDTYIGEAYLNAYSLNSSNDLVLLFNTTKPKNEKTLYGDLNGDGMLDMLIPPKESYYDIITTQIPVWAPYSCPYCNHNFPIIRLLDVDCRHCGRDIKPYCTDLSNKVYCHECKLPLTYCVTPPDFPTDISKVPCCPTHGPSVIVHMVLGYIDNGDTWSAYYATGNGFLKKNISIFRTNRDDKYYLMDVNSDGLADLIQQGEEAITTFLNVKGQIEMQYPEICIPAPKNTNIVQANMATNNAISYFISVKDYEVTCYSFTKDESKNHLLTSMIDSHGLVSENVYTSMINGENYFSTSTTRRYPYSSIIAPLNLLSNTVLWDNNHTATSNNYYYYSGAVMERTGLGFCGFEEIKTVDIINNVTTIEKKDPEKFGITTGITSSIVEAAYTYNLNFDPFTKIVNPTLSFSSEKDKLKNTTLFKSFEYDEYNNPTQIGSNYSDDPGAATSIVTQTYSNIASSELYLIGQPLIKTVLRTRTGESWIDKEEISYHSHRSPRSKITYTGSYGNNKTSEIQWEYDLFRNVVSEKAASYNNTLFLGKTYTYDPSGRYITEETNALNQATSFSGYDKYGNPSISTDYKGNATTCTYDEWGETSSITHPDGVTENTTIAWGGIGLYTVTKTATGQPDVITHYDALGREIRIATKRFDNQWQYSDTKYDYRGRIEKKSLPYKSGSQLWNIYTYDQYNRPLTITEASGKVTSWIYNGKSVTETKDGITSTKTYDSGGELISVSDPGGTINYILRSDGQPAGIMANGIPTSFDYDQCGRRKYISDPSAGTKLFTETYADNCKISTVTDANGKTITSRYDIYGRIASVQRPEFNTTYTYNSDGLLTNETSTNSTSKVITYDELDRIKTVTQTTSGKYLQREYTYSDGNIISTKYTSNGGVVGTENFSYSNGYNTEIKFNNTVSIWKLTAENAFGQPISETTGNLNRTYGYTQFGFPTSITTGTIQNFAYNFDPATGNLLSRTDVTRNITETFQYDNLNRLTNAAGKSITYADNGNILQKQGIGSFSYHNMDRPYQLTGHMAEHRRYSDYEQILNHTSFNRPNWIDEEADVLQFTYDASYDRAKADYYLLGDQLQEKYYFSNKYETEQYYLESTKRIERLYLGGDAYSAPAVYVIEDGVGKIYYICRDYLGSITHVLNEDGSLKQEVSYDAWGALRDPATHIVYNRGEQPKLFLGRGYTGHEHLQWFNLINMNARLYDPSVGRFLSPDPYVQAPDNTQNFNRYIYCLNNPFLYRDKNGELFGIDDLIIGLIGGVVNLTMNLIEGNVQNFGHGAALFGVGFAGSILTVYTGPVGAALMSAGNSMINQSFITGKIDFGQVGISAIMGGITSSLGLALGNVIASPLSSLTSNISSPVVQNMVTSGVGGAAVGFTLETGLSLVNGENFKDAISNGGMGAVTGMGVGAVSGGAIALRQSYTQGFNPWTGEFIHPNSLESKRPTYGYKLYLKEDGTFLKNGITSKNPPETRYSSSYMYDKNMLVKKVFSNRLKAYQWEYKQNLIKRGPLNKNMH